MDTKFNTHIKITLEPIGSPEVKISVLDQVKQLVLNHESSFEFHTQSYAGNLVIAVEMLNKAHNDPSTAVVIKSITFNNVSHEKFAWQGCYRPDYPPHLADQNPELPGQTYLSWNGRYELPVTVPIFTWMHRVLDFGWIHD